MGKTTKNAEQLRDNFEWAIELLRNGTSVRQVCNLTGISKYHMENINRVYVLDEPAITSIKVNPNRSTRMTEYGYLRSPSERMYYERRLAGKT